MPKALPIVPLLLASACATPPEAQTARAVLERLRAFQAAERERDPDRLLTFLAEDFSMFQDGQRVDRATTEQQMRSTLPTLARFEPSFEDIQVLVLAPDAVVTSLTFRDAITLADGTVQRSHGPSTMVWRKRAGEWLMVFADSDHYPR